MSKKIPAVYQNRILIQTQSQIQLDEYANWSYWMKIKPKTQY